MEWTNVNERLPKIGEPCWYFFELLGKHRGFYGGLYIDDDGKEWPGMSIFYNDYKEIGMFQGLGLITHLTK